MLEKNKIYNIDCLKGLKELSDNCVDLVVTDPPYGYSFMGKSWDKGVPTIDIWRECLRVLKPGSFTFIMSAPRQDVQAQMILNLKEAGFELKFSPMYWAYATGFPKAMNVRKTVVSKRRISPDQIKTLDGSYGGFQPKPAVEVILVAMKPLSEKTFVDQALKNCKGVTWIDDCRVPYESDKNGINAEEKRNRGVGANQDRFPANLLINDDVLNDGNSNSSFSRYFSLDAWWQQRLEKLPNNARRTFPFMIVPKASKKEKNVGCDGVKPQFMDKARKVGSKGGCNPRNRGAEKMRKNYHPTVKPIKLMSYLVTLGSREKDVVLDPFMGSGTTAIACKISNRNFMGFEMNKEYIDIANKRLKGWK